jgi:hypothetical protein
VPPLVLDRYRDPRARRILLFGALLAALAVTEFIVGVWVGSLALLTDAIHLSSDLAALTVGLAAIKVGAARTRPLVQHSTHSHTDALPASTPSCRLTTSTPMAWSAPHPTPTPHR